MTTNWKEFYKGKRKGILTDKDIKRYRKKTRGVGVLTEGDIKRMKKEKTKRVIKGVAKKASKLAIGGLRSATMKAGAKVGRKVIKAIRKRKKRFKKPKTRLLRK